MLNRVMKWACAVLIVGGFGTLGIMSIEIFDYLEYRSVTERVFHGSDMENQSNRGKPKAESAAMTETGEDIPLPVQVDKEQLTKENHFGRSTADKKVDIENNVVSINNEPGMAIHSAHQSIDNLRNGDIGVKGLADEKAEGEFVTSIVRKEIHTIRGFGYAEDDMTGALELLDRYEESDEASEKEEVLQELDAIFYKLDRKHNAWDNHNQTVLP
ncbi:hypothetical protein [Sediminibacillus sp. JSM 1682029]|uniref:hypothetical protein n=1 Tax=Sediminibacillus sp. JSM 1682029 TaxID=3229857 RepID=UPI0035238D70